MFSVESPRLTATIAVWFILLAKVCLGMKEVAVEEGKELTLTCSGNTTKSLKNIWWVSSNKVLSTCYNGNERCTNNDADHTATISFHYNQKYTSKLTIGRVTSHHRNQVFKCVDDGSEPSSAGQSIILRVYHVPESPVCETEELSRGRIKILCQTPKVFPNIICEISPEFNNPTPDMLESSGNFSDAETITNVMYTNYLFKDGAAYDNTAWCSGAFCSRRPGGYRFKVKMYPNVTNSLVASVDGYTNTVTILPSDENCAVGVLQANENNGQSIAETKEEINKMNAQPLIGEQSSEYQRGQSIEMDMKEMICENDKTIIEKQLVVILVLACLLVCNFLFNGFLLLKYKCKNAKRPYDDRV